MQVWHRIADVTCKLVVPRQDHLRGPIGHRGGAPPRGAQRAVRASASQCKQVQAACREPRAFPPIAMPGERGVPAAEPRSGSARDLTLARSRCSECSECSACRASVGERSRSGSSVSWAWSGMVCSVGCQWTSSRPRPDSPSHSATAMVQPWCHGALVALGCLPCLH